MANKRILIVGAGVVGYNLAKQLSVEHQSITVIDESPPRVHELAKLDCRQIEGNGAYPSVLLDAGIETADIIIAVTDNDSVNVMICLLATQLGKTKGQRRIARVRNPEYASGMAPKARSSSASNETRRLLSTNLFAEADGFEVMDDSGGVRVPAIVDYMINPDLTIVETIVRFLDSPGATEVADFAGGSVQLRRFPVPKGCQLDGLKLRDTSKFTAMEPFIIAAIIRGKQTLIPSGDDVIQAGDEVVFIMPEGVQHFIVGLVGRAIAETRKVMISGATPLGLTLALRLETLVDQVVMIEPDRKLAEKASAALTHTQVLHGRPTDVEFLREIGLETTDDFIALEGDDSSNLMTALLAKHLGAKQTIMLVHEVEYLPVLTHIGVDIAINSRLLTIGAILRYIRGDNVLSVAKFAGDTAEAIEVIAEENTRMVGTKLADLRLKGVLIGAVQRGEDIIIPRGDTVVQPGDHVTLLSLAGSIGNLEKLIGKRRRLIF